jgi:hypothetical protein
LGGKKVKVIHKEVISGVQGTIKRFRINARNQDGSIKYIGNVLGKENRLGETLRVASCFSRAQGSKSHERQSLFSKLSYRVKIT